jgi:outer membrane receptor protein involved in Fe transport
MYTTPLSDTVAVSVAGGYNRRDGFVHDGNTGANTNNRNRWFVRGQLLWVPDNGPRVRIIADYSRIDETCCAVVNLLSSSSTAAINSLGGRVNSPSNPLAMFITISIRPTASATMAFRRRLIMKSAG